MSRVNEYLAIAGLAVVIVAFVASLVVSDRNLEKRWRAAEAQARAECREAGGKPVAQKCVFVTARGVVEVDL